jgi:hypothetical protein
MSIQHDIPRTYRIYLLDELGQVSGVRVVESQSDAPAVGEAVSIIRKNQVEVWQSDVRVARFQIEPKDNLVAFPSGVPEGSPITAPRSRAVSKPARFCAPDEEDSLLVVSDTTPANDRLSTLCSIAAILACIAGIIWAATHPF